VRLYSRPGNDLTRRFPLIVLEGLGAMPAGLIEEENSVSARSDFGCDFIEVKLHSSVLQAGSTRAAPAPRSGQTAPKT
jgi:hypothetical protein